MIETPPNEAEEAARALRVCVVDSARTGTAYPRLAECGDIEVIGKVPWLDGRFLPPDLIAEADAVVVGMGTEEMRDRDRQHELLRLARTTKVIVVAPGPLDAEIAAQLGVRGLVSKDVDPGAFTRVVRAVAAGEIAFPRNAITTLFQLIGKLAIPLHPSEDSTLTPRQREVIALIAGGATDREVALRLRISESTAHKHVQNALRRSRAKTRSQLVALVRQEPFATS
ncbi:MAG TPA: response regulator transcription factor [Candidatus Limnocylindria bacterium]